MTIRRDDNNTEVKHSDNPYLNEIREQRKGQKQGAAFVSRTREQIFEKFIQQQTRGPPVGTYRTRYNASDPKISAPLYGTQQTWGGELAKRADRIKDQHFRATVRKCDRLDKTLVYQRVKMHDSSAVQQKTVNKSQKEESTAGWFGTSIGKSGFSSNAKFDSIDDKNLEGTQ